jgi:DNA polymerase-3 subunit delta'
MQQLLADLALKPARGKRKIAIVDDADDLNEESANCFLKTLEEPPPGSILILIGTSADRQLSTVRSRCQVIPFQPLPEPLVATFLQSDSELEPALAMRLARASGGNLGLARELADPALWKIRSRLLAAVPDPRADAIELSAEFRKWVEQVGKDTAAQRRRAALVVHLVIQGLEAALAGAAGIDPDDTAILGKLRSLGPDRLVESIERCLTAQEKIERRVQLVLIVEALVDALVPRRIATVG